jgi:hypothetical protein
MSRNLLLLAVAAFPLGGCAAAIAANAVGMAAGAARGRQESNAHLGPEAARLCSERAAPHGTVRIIDVEQRSASKLIVWGTVDDGNRKQSFECAYGTKITGFKLRPIGD